MVAGTVSTIITAPMDMIKTRLMLQRESKEAGNYKNGFHCAYQVFKFVFIFILHRIVLFISLLNVCVIAIVGNFVTLTPDITKPLGQPFQSGFLLKGGRSDI